MILLCHRGIYQNSELDFWWIEEGNTMTSKKSSGGLNAWVNQHIMPVAAKIGGFKPLIAVRDGIAMAMPLIIVGSLIHSQFQVGLIG